MSKYENRGKGGNNEGKKSVDLNKTSSKQTTEIDYESSSNDES